jgi:hypothetical protein
MGWFPSIIRGSITIPPDLITPIPIILFAYTDDIVDQKIRGVITRWVSIISLTGRNITRGFSTRGVPSGRDFSQWLRGSCYAILRDAYVIVTDPKDHGTSFGLDNAIGAIDQLGEFRTSLWVRCLSAEENP